MGLLSDLQSVPSLTLVLVSLGGFLVYLISLAVYRLYLSPLANYPGPKLAALSKWYEFYYEVVCGGQFTVHIRELHKQYGSAHVCRLGYRY
jgi:hypothetical protein